ncbi:uracil-DNA glycosylase [Guyanagaster necrorhizus]|uniref:Uracil-DNA glycosylase n=1 Tax=Guyanagaster necrorhizus TaxID=856835 RepID=A0A9P7W294_9AGAR|nr:uracil-DNA glycosylase [Guyanagaster necrorhizus MCA 3950]KAG7451075.1 uracil-DNA glycosylase [Guyanagaster necrorhizus MCA 3950]
MESHESTRESLVYLEDLDIPPSTSVKRQRTLMDMFANSQGKNASEPSAKKLKLSPASSTRQGMSSIGKVTKGFGVQKLNSIPFSMSAFQESLTDEQRGLLRLECEAMGKSWLKLLKDEIKKPYFLSLKQFLREEGVRGINDSPLPLKVYPPPKDIYSWSNTPLGKVKVVIIGQDPYHGRGQAHGLCFSVPLGVTIPPSLRNIYAEIKAEYPEFTPPKHGNLTAWATNGVLMLNTCLTVRANTAGSHSEKGWEQFTDKVVDVIDKYGGANLPSKLAQADTGLGRGIVFLAWGAWAAKRVAKLDKTKHLILTSAHPSPFSAHKGFLGNGHFKAANEWLERKYGSDGIVDWCTLNSE